MLNHWLIDLIGHLSGLSDAQLREIEKSWPATKALIDLLPVRAFSTKDEAVRFAGRQLGGHYAVYHKDRKIWPIP